MGTELVLNKSKTQNKKRVQYHVLNSLLAESEASFAEGKEYYNKK